MTDMLTDGYERRCGFKGCRRFVIPGAYVEGAAMLGHAQQATIIRVEVCDLHLAACTGESLTGLGLDTP